MFGRDLFGEPGWEILLAIYIGEQHNDGPTITNLTGLSGVSPSVTLRWLNVLTDEGHVERVAHSTSPDRMHVHLTAAARDALELYLSETLAETH
ncbi:winged helix-turn-helix transcriptional regulator [Sphingomonas daechungensis]|uniref:Winged helix-turn-helix transcriptional regulator n=2 Tax=Sphingomonas daechungensis TaxID=1176646 RepID=A0ABX6SZJ6_9SPHN|nr:MarR family winged helix-turn-helix transcriptional regulator [Sphingomonas daechungensis]QNP42388.1 winged helix-turn-helix transcriptional regulator [Sphingomonas daechungensis]